MYKAFELLTFIGLAHDPSISTDDIGAKHLDFALARRQSGGESVGAGQYWLNSSYAKKFSTG